MRSYWSMALSLKITRVLIRRHCDDTGEIFLRRHRHTGRRKPCEDGAKIEVLQPQPEEHLGPPEDREKQRIPLLEISEGAWPCWFWFQISRLQTVRQYVPVVLSHPVAGILLQQPRNCHALLHWTSLVAQMVKRLPIVRETWVQSLGWEDLLEKEMATHSSTLAWKTPWTEGPGRLQSLGLQRVRHDWTTSHSALGNQ